MEDSAKASSQKEHPVEIAEGRPRSVLEKERPQMVGGPSSGRSVVIEARVESLVASARVGAAKDAPVETREEFGSLQASPPPEVSFSSSNGSGSALPAAREAKTVDRLALEQSDLRVAFARLLASGTTLPAAIDTLGIEKHLAASFLASDGFQELLKSHLPKVEDVRDVLLAHASQAALKIVHLMNSAKSEEECGRSARDLLDRVGVVAKKHVSVASYHFHEAKSTLVEETLKEIRGSVLSSNGGS